MSIRARLNANLGAGSFSFAVNALVQFVSIPLFLSYWQSALYAEWLVPNAVAEKNDGPAIRLPF